LKQLAQTASRFDDRRRFGVDVRFWGVIKEFGLDGTYAVQSSPALADRELTILLVGSGELCGGNSARMSTGGRSGGAEIEAIVRDNHA